jgi:hypothetical protein
MIRSRRLTLALLNAWLIDQRVSSTHPNYRLRVWREDPNAFPPIQQELSAYVAEAMDDARQKLRRGFEDNLSPFSEIATDPAANYPALLHRITLQGYWGETLGILAIEHWGASGHSDWVVPALLFRFHDQEFQHLESINERILAGETYDPDAVTERRPGRTGDDGGLAFRINADNVITDILALEAKCLSTSSTAKITEAHQKLTAGSQRPSGIRELVNLLAEYNTPAANTWQQALITLWSRGYGVAVRHDAIAYTCGNIPVRPPSRIAWLSPNAPHAAYTSTRYLEGLEFQFPNLSSVIDLIYRPS